MTDILEIPEELKNWRPLSEYNKQWLFISYGFRYRIAEHLAAIDYFHAVFNYLNPRLVFSDVHKRMILILIASIYECVLADAVRRTAQKELSESKLLKQFVSKDKLSSFDKDEFKILINNGANINLINDEWKEYLHKIRNIRNWIHLSKERDENLIKWFNSQTIESLKQKLNEFRNISLNYFSQL